MVQNLENGINFKSWSSNLLGCHAPFFKSVTVLQYILLFLFIVDHLSHLTSCQFLTQKQIFQSSVAFGQSNWENPANSVRAESIVNRRAGNAENKSESFPIEEDNAENESDESEDSDTSSEDSFKEDNTAITFNNPLKVWNSLHVPCLELFDPQQREIPCPPPRQA